MKTYKEFCEQLVDPQKSSQLRSALTTSGKFIRPADTGAAMQRLIRQSNMFKRLGIKSLKDIDDRNP